MKRLIIGSFLGACLLFLVAPAKSQDKPSPPKDEVKSAEVRPDGPQLKVQIVFVEYEGEKKVKSLPYTLLLRAEHGSHATKIRIGSRVPVATAIDKAAPFQYFEVGTNLDCSATPAQDGKYQLQMDLERSWVEGGVPVDPEKSAAPPKEPDDTAFRQPVIHQFKFDNTIDLRDGQTLETNFATDPVSGKVIKVEVTLNVLK